MIIAYTILFFNVVLSNSVFWEPEVPVPGGEITIYYNTIEGELPGNTFPVYVHLGYDGWEGTQDYAMQYSPSEGTGWWKFVYEIPESVETIDFVFTDLNDNWDNNGGIGIDWHISLNYYWYPFNPTPNDNVEIVLNNIDQSGKIVWTVDAGNGHVAPIESYWPDDTYIQNGIVYSPLELIDETSASIDFNPFQSGEQIISSLKFKILWDDGTFDVGNNGQIIYYDIYFDFNPGLDDPYVSFISPNQNDELTGDIQIELDGDADIVELWLDGNLLTSLNSEPFEYLWTPPSGVFGDLKLIAKSMYDNGSSSFTFLDFYLQYNVVQESAPLGLKDGLNINGNDVVIAIYAPGKEYVSIKGSWNDNFPNGEIMKLSGDTLWWYQTNLEDGIYSYQYNLDGIKYIADPWSEDVDWKDPFTGYESGNFQHAKTVFEIGVEEYQWSDDLYERPEVKDLIIYELHIGDFLGVEGQIGTYSTVLDSINSGYFSELGINAIELMPINEFEGDYSWGYNTSFAMAPESTYGSNEDLKNLINIAHENGIAILLDVVFNHLWGSSPLFQLYHPLDDYSWDAHDFSICPYFDNAPSDWGYKLQHWHSLNGRNYRGWKHVDDALVHWVEEYHIDGFRFDYVEGIGWDGDYNGASYYANMLDNIDPSLILIAEADNSYQINNTDFDSGWDYSYHHNLFDNILDIYFDVDNITNHINAYSQGYGFVTGPINYIESHDESRLIYQSTEFQGDSLEDACKRSKIGATILFTSHGVPMIYQGQEFAQNSQHRDSGGYPISQPLQWENLQNDFELDLNQHYKKLIHLRNDNDVLKQPPLDVKYSNNENKTLVYWRVDNNEKVIIAINLDTNSHTIDLEFPDSGTWYDHINDFEISIDTNWYGGFELSPLTSYVFTSSETSIQCSIGDINQDTAINVVDIVALVNYILGGTLSDEGVCASDLNGDTVINVIDIVALVNTILSL
jgi:1,4-alpha-glucan branching enzyme